MKKRTFIILIVIVLAFIWGHSLIPTDSSSEESIGIMKIMQAVLDFLNIPVTLSENFVRKLAHFTEHAVAGALIGLFVYPRFTAAATKRERIECAILPLIVGFFIGFIDETIQIFSGRGPLIQDVWIDFFGIFLGVSVAYLIVYLRNRQSGKSNAGIPDPAQTKRL